MARNFHMHRLDETTPYRRRQKQQKGWRIFRWVTVSVGILYAISRRVVMGPKHLNWGKSLGRFILFSVAGGTALLSAYLLFIWMTLPDISDQRSFLAAESTVITDRNGIELYRLYQEEDRTFLEEDLIPTTAKQAIVAIEDERYYERGCLDVRALARMAVGFGRAGGASTLTRQLARNALDLKNENILNRKVKELILGCQMESRYEKDQLLSLYLNWIPFGQNAYGIEQASQVYFGKSGTGLTLAESAVLAALPQRPTYFSPYGSHVRTEVDPAVYDQIVSGEIDQLSQIPDGTITIGLLGNYIGTGSTVVYIGGRTDQVLQNMEDQGFITDEERQGALDELNTIVFEPSRESIRAPHFVLWVKEQVEELLLGDEQADSSILEQGGLIIETTLDLDLQEAAEDAVADHREDTIDRFGAYNIALVTLDPYTREVLAYVGNADFNDEEHGGKIDMAQAPRQPGSSFKPFVYMAAFEEGYSPATVLYDVPTKIGDNEPQNFDSDFWGPMTIRDALGASRNIPAAKAFFLGGGEENILQLVASLGAQAPLNRRDELAQQRDGGFDYGWPLALGAAETPLIEMVHAYSSIADKGTYKPVVSIRRITDKNGNILFEAEQDVPGSSIVDERIAYQITSVLSDESARPEEFWRNQLTIPGYQTAAKTGTSNKCLEWRDENTCQLRKPDNAWLMGYTPELVTGVWVGNADSSALFDRGGGLNTASPIWRDYMIAAHRQLEAPQTAFAVPDKLVQPQISKLSGQLVAECTPITHRKADIFLEENAPKETDTACGLLTVDKVTGLLASDTCPEDAQEEKAFFIAHSILPDRWPLWEEAVQDWATEQMEIWDASETHSGSLLVLPLAPSEVCDPSLTPGRLIEPELTIVSPSENRSASFPAFTPVIDFSVGSTVLEMRYYIDGKRVAVETEAPFVPSLRVPRTVEKEGMHTLEVELTDEYFNKVTATTDFRFDDDTQAPVLRIESPIPGAIFTPSDSLTITATADDPGGGLKYVQFYLDDVLLSTKPRAPFTVSYSLSDIEEGTHTVRAVAYDLADQESIDSVRIDVRSSGGSADGYAIIEPADEVVTTPNSAVAITLNVPTVTSDDATTIEAIMIAEGQDIDNGDVVLRLRDTEGGTYRREWQSRVPGTYILLLTTISRTGEREIQQERRIIVE